MKQRKNMLKASFTGLFPQRTKTILLLFANFSHYVFIFSTKIWLPLGEYSIMFTKYRAACDAAKRIYEFFIFILSQTYSKKPVVLVLWFPEAINKPVESCGMISPTIKVLQHYFSIKFIECNGLHWDILWPQLRDHFLKGLPD